MFLTLDRLMAAAFTLKSDDVLGISVCDGVLAMTFLSEPPRFAGGWLYTCTERDGSQFEECIVRGQPTNKWVSYQKVHIHACEFIPGLHHLLRATSTDAYVLSDDVDWKEWIESYRYSAFANSLPAFYSRSVRKGTLRSLRAEWSL